MPRRVSRDEAVAAVRALLVGRTVFVGLDGLGGSGKSTLAAALADATPRAVVIPTDDFQGPGVPEWDWPRLHAQVVEPLLAGRDGRYEVWKWGEPFGRGWRTVPAGALVIIEGVSATRSEFAAPWDLTIWVDARRDVRRTRTAERDGPETERLWREHWWPAEEAYVAREHPERRAELIVDGSGGKGAS